MAVLPLALLAGVSLSHQRALAVEESYDRLDGLAETQVAHLESVVSADQEIADLLSRDARLRAALDPDNADDLSADLPALLANAIESSDRLVNICLHGADGTLVATSDGSAQQRYSANEILPGSQDIRARLISGPSGFPTMLTTSEVRVDGAVVGRVVVETDARSISSLATTHTRMTETGETSIAQPTAEGAQFIAPLRFKEDAVLNLTVPASKSSAPISLAMAGFEDRFGDTVDYRNEPVLAVTRHIEGPGWGVVVKIDKAEAMAGVASFERTLLAALLAVLILTILAASLMSRWVWKPVQELTSSVAAVASGDRSRRADVPGSGELSQLAASVNTMTDDLTAALASATERQKELKAVNGLLAKREGELQSIFENAADGMITTDEQGLVHRLNRAGQGLFNISASQARGLPVASLLSSEDIPPQQLFQVAADEQGDGVEMKATPRGRPDVSVHVTVSKIEANGEVWYIGALRDMSERLAFESRLSHQANHDDVTGLPNRTFLRCELEEALDRSKGLSEKVAVLFLDLDQFKLVNDSRGHAAGDKLLRKVAERLTRAVRRDDIVARFGGDEFVVLSPNVSHAHQVQELANRLHAAFEAPIPLDGELEHVGCSIGAALSAGDADPDELISDADVAMYRAKSTGRSRTVMFDADMRGWVEARHQLESALRNAIEGNDILVEYQPIIELKTGEICGVEGLARWTRPGHGPISPAEFIPVAEESGLIVPLGRSVLRQACIQQVQWKRAHEDFGIRITVNMSARELVQPDCVSAVVEILRETGADASGLLIEVTETALSDDLDLAATHLHALRDLGLAIAVDDFGTGYSSLTYLRKFPLDIVKIDRSFMAELENGSTDSSIVSLVIGLGETLGIKVVAEGVETESQLHTLRAMGCEFAQGFLFARPQPPEDVSNLLWPEFQVADLDDLRIDAATADLDGESFPR